MMKQRRKEIKFQKDNIAIVSSIVYNDRPVHLDINVTDPDCFQVLDIYNKDIKQTTRRICIKVEYNPKKLNYALNKIYIKQ